MLSLSSTCWWNVTLILVPPFLAILYAIGSALFLAYFRECPSWSTHLPPVVPRISVWIALAAATMATHSLSSSSLLSSSSSNDDHHPVCFARLGLLVMSLVWSMYAIHQTRVHVVEGGPAPDLLLLSSVSGCNCSATMKDKIVVITGANTGIGLETAIQLAQQGAKLLITCRSEDKAREAMKEILVKGKAAGAAEVMVQYVLMDLSSLASVQRAAAEIIAKRGDLLLLSSSSSLHRSATRQEQDSAESLAQIDVLILNAGVMMGQHVITKDGFELTMQANHLGHYLFTRILLDASVLKRNGGRVVTLTSSTYSFVDGMDLDDLFCTKGQRPYTLFGQYEMSKLANILFTTELQRRYPRLWTAAVHPGLVRTAVVRNMPWYLYYPNIIFSWALWTLQKTPAQGAWCTTHVASCPQLPPGKYWVNRQVQELWPCAKDTAAAAALWKDSAKYVGLDP